MQYWYNTKSGQVESEVDDKRARSADLLGPYGSEDEASRALEIAREYRLTAPVSVAITKRLLWEGLDSGFAAMREREIGLFAWLGNQPDAREGIASFVEKREPAWSMSARRDLPDLL